MIPSLRTRSVACLLVAAVTAPAFAQSNVDATNKYAWGENIGWTNWRDANASAQGAQIVGLHMRGYVWAENAGWIDLGQGLGSPADQYLNTSNTNYGVNIDATDGWLSGFAWAENLGWFNFDTASLEPFGQRARWDPWGARLRGYAWSENAGWLNMDDQNAFVQFNLGCSIADITADGVCTPGSGEGSITLSDFSCFLSLWSSGGLLADLTTSGSCNPGTGDGIVDLSDFSCYLTLWSAGCP